MFTKNLNEFNKTVYERMHKFYKHFQLGFFNSNLVLFIGQNPGKPFTDPQRAMITQLQEYDDYFKYEEAYTEQWKRSLFGDFIGRVIKGYWNQISFTNLIKIPTQNNEIPDKNLIDIFWPITQKQIEILQPKMIICLGKFVGSFFDIHHFYEFKNNIVLFPHPAYVLRQGTMATEHEIEIMNAIINDYLINHEKENS